MTRRALAVALLSGIAAVAAIAQTGARRIIDLTHPFSADSIYWPNADGFKLTVDSAGMTHQGYYYAANSFCAGEHGGTHMDAPLHFAQGMPSIDQIPVERLVAPGVLVDVQAAAVKNPDYLAGVDDFLSWEKANGRIPDGSILLLRTGWGRFYQDRKKYLGTDRRGEDAIAELHFPGLDPAAAAWIAGNRAIAAFGIDTASIDRGQSQKFECHQTLFKAGIYALENVANLDQLPAKGFEIIALPMKIKGGSGAPARIIALLR